MFKIANGRTSFWQWDTGQKLIVNDDSCFEVHFCNKGDDYALVCEVYEQDGKKFVDVPNVLLQTTSQVCVYAYKKNNTETCTVHETRFAVLQRPKPDDYVYTKTEVLTYEKLDARIKALEDNGGSSADDLIGQLNEAINQKIVFVEFVQLEDQDYNDRYVFECEHSYQWFGDKLKQGAIVYGSFDGENILPLINFDTEVCFGNHIFPLREEGGKSYWTDYNSTYRRMESKIDTAAKRLIVEFTPGENVASANATQIYDHIQNGGIALLCEVASDGDMNYINLSKCNPYVAEFVATFEDHTATWFGVDEEANVHIVDLSYASLSYVDYIIKEQKRYIIPLVENDSGDYVINDRGSFKFDWDELVSAVKGGADVYCRYTDNDEMRSSSYIYYYPLVALYIEDSYASFARSEGSACVDDIYINADGYVHHGYRYLVTDTTLAEHDKPADAWAVGQKLGDIETAFDSVISIQENLLTPDGDEVSY